MENTFDLNQPKEQMGFRKKFSATVIYGQTNDRDSDRIQDLTLNGFCRFQKAFDTVKPQSYFKIPKKWKDRPTRYGYWKASSRNYDGRTKDYDYTVKYLTTWDLLTTLLFSQKKRETRNCFRNFNNKLAITTKTVNTRVAEQCVKGKS